MNVYYILNRYASVLSVQEFEDYIIVLVHIPYKPEEYLAKIEEELIKINYYVEIKPSQENKFILRLIRIPKPQKQNYALHLILLILTIISTIIAGAFQEGVNPFSRDIIKGIPFSLSIMSILIFHEMGHYILSKKFKVDATLPYFIPFPNPLIGTMGAIIKLRSIIPNRKALLHIGAAGPWFGLIIAIFVLIIGLKFSKVIPLDEASRLGFSLGESILFKLISYTLLGDTSDKVVILHPIAFAGWLGLFVTNLNLLPIGQLDGGHIAYSLFGKHQKYISYAVWIALIVFGFLYWGGWLVWAILAFVLGIEHPKPLNDYTKLSKLDKLYAILSLALFILTFTPNPIKV
ncbi:MAG: site-2 protease family protein [candidate division WOR-3 bacterium]